MGLPAPATMNLRHTDPLTAVAIPGSGRCDDDGLVLYSGGDPAADCDRGRVGEPEGDRDGGVWGDDCGDVFEFGDGADVVVWGADFGGEGGWEEILKLYWINDRTLLVPSNQPFYDHGKTNRR